MFGTKSPSHLPVAPEDSTCPSRRARARLASVPALAQPLNPTDAYRREARRLRCRYAGRPAHLHRSLRALADASPKPVTVTATTSRPSRFEPATGLASAQSGPARNFADYLARQMTSSVLRYSQRLELLRSARRFGIGRFEANLLIAAVLERHRTRVLEADETRGSSVVSQVAAVLAVQGALLLGVWWTLFR